MKKLTLEQYISYYETNKKLPHPQSNWQRKNPFTERELKSKYRDYEKKVSSVQEKKINPKKSTYMDKVDKAMEEARNLDPNYDVWRNFFYNKLNENERQVILNEMWMCPINKETGKSTYDVAHIFERSIYPNLADKIENLVLVPRPFHTSIDNYLNPFSKDHEKLSKEEHDQIWIKLIGIERWEKLLYIKNND